MGPFHQLKTGSFRLDGNDLTGLFFQHFAHAGNRTARTDTATKYRLYPSVSRQISSAVVSWWIRVRLVIELARHEISIGMFVHQGVFCNRPCHTFRTQESSQFRRNARSSICVLCSSFRHRDWPACSRAAHHLPNRYRIAAGRLHNYGILPIAPFWRLQPSLRRCGLTLPPD